jgi:hypothetical protein
VENGYLAVETHGGRPGMVRLIVSPNLPPATTDVDSPTRLRYAARFNDSSAALMHTHELLKRRLVDCDSHLYRVDLAQAIGAIESIDLTHRDVFLDAALDDPTRKAIDAVRNDMIRRRERKTHFFEAMGYIGIGLLLFNLFVLSFH